MNALVYRGLRLFFKNRQAVMGAFIAAIILIVLYVFLLGDNLASQLSAVAQPQMLVDTWMLAGVIGIVSASSTFGAASLLTRDRERNVYTDFMISPIKKSKIMLGYFLSTFLVSLLITVAVVIISELYIVFVSGGALLSLKQAAMLAVACLFTVFCSSAFMFFIVSFFNRMDTFSTMTSIIGPLLGFITGCYVPIGSLPETAHTVVNYFPLTSGIVLIRQILTENVLATENTQVTQTIKEELGITMNFQHETFVCLAILAISGIVFLAIALWNIKRFEAKR
ncbi:hypothetical protein BAU15_02800 [Enterococcus sp. JM4C]|uniref:ABC transporter permease n=1 Tax=Candidatus Enterococcus huntleyi TaxID=1857217 RepID=UPI00137A15A1|nr:ABC transporter permease [Enterococcus sp. JM4C]KAF1299590.1 hypothetical protein BAU15_02800 [Enterococcus sp. JM4C]